MSGRQFLRIPEHTAAEICARFSLKQEASALLRSGMSPEEFAEALVAGKQYITGIDFMAHALPARDAVWWGCLCLQHAYGDNLPPAEREACRAAVQWVVQPTDSNRAAVLVPAQMAGVASVAGGLAMAVYQTGENVAPPHMPPAAPQPFAPAKAVAGAIKMACTKTDPVKIIEMQRLFLELGMGMAQGRPG
jgi:hypothetical protein